MSASIGEAQLNDEQLAPIVKALKDGTLLPSKVAPGLRQAFIRIHSIGTFERVPNRQPQHNLLFLVA